MLFGHRTDKLRMNVAPLTYPPHIDKVFSQQSLMLAIRQLMHRIVAPARVT